MIWPSSGPARPAFRPRSWRRGLSTTEHARSRFRPCRQTAADSIRDAVRQTRQDRCGRCGGHQCGRYPQGHHAVTSSNGRVGMQRDLANSRTADQLRSACEDLLKAVSHPEAVTACSITQRAGTNIGAANYHFGSVEQLILSDAERVQEGVVLDPAGRGSLRTMPSSSPSTASGPSA
jgi:hypothetical protein